MFLGFCSALKCHGYIIIVVSFKLTIF
uniref:Uncharacterized protein n=1 Tax=Rhizophora mucronata TaxID=61149 RepID=A0A2P2J1G7_RHIMU